MNVIQCEIATCERGLDMDMVERRISPFRRFNFLAPWRTGLGVRSAKISFFHIPRGKDTFPSFPCDFQKVARRRDTVHSFTIRRVSLYLYSWTRNFASLAWPKTSSRRLRWPTLVRCWWKKEKKRKRNERAKECVGRSWSWTCIIFSICGKQESISSPFFFHPLWKDTENM